MTANASFDKSRGRILCLHGDGTNAEIFEAQLRRISQALSTQFELICVNGPFECAPGYGVSPFFDDCGPFYRWLRLEDSFGDSNESSMTTEMYEACNGVLNIFGDLQYEFGGDEEAFDGILGFSSSGGIVAGILKHQQEALSEGRKPVVKFRFKFGVLINGQGTPLPFDRERSFNQSLIKIPTVQVVGLKDEWKDSSLRLGSFFDQDCTMNLELDNDHSVPAKMDHAHQLAQIVAGMQTVAS